MKEVTDVDEATGALFPYYLKNEKKKIFMKVTSGCTAWEVQVLQTGKQKWIHRHQATNFGSKELMEQRLEGFQPSTEDEYLSALTGLCQKFESVRKQINDHRERMHPDWYKGNEIRV